MKISKTEYNLFFNVNLILVEFSIKKRTELVWQIYNLEVRITKFGERNILLISYVTIYKYDVMILYLEMIGVTIPRLCPLGAFIYFLRCIGCVKY